MEGELLQDKRRAPDRVEETLNRAAKEPAFHVESKILWHVLWGAMAIMAAGSALTRYPIFSGGYALLFSFLLAAVAGAQLANGVSFLTRKEVALAVVLLILFGAARLDLRFIQVAVDAQSADFSAYYVAGKLVVEKHAEDLYQFQRYPDGRMRWFDTAPPGGGYQKAAARYGVVPAFSFIYPPPFAVFMRPFTHFSYGVAYTLWTAVTVLLALVSILISLSLGGVRVSIKLSLILIVGLFSYYPFCEELILGQVGLVVLFLCACGIWLLSRNKIWVSAFCLALATLIKLTPIIVIPLLVFHRRWKWLAAYGCWMVCLLGVSIWQVGWGAHVQFFHNVMPSISRGTPVLSNVSIVAYVQDLFLGHIPLMARAPPAMPPLACVVSKMVSLVLCGAMMLRFYFYRGEQHLIRHLVLVMLLSLVLSPVTWWHHYTLAILPFLYLWCVLRESDRDLLLLAAVFVVGTNVAAYVLILSSNHVVQFVVAAVVPGLTLALVYLRIPGGVEARSASEDPAEEPVRSGAVRPA